MFMRYAITFLISVDKSFDFEMKKKKNREKKFKKSSKRLLPGIELRVADCRSDGLTTVPPRRPRELISRNACNGQS